MKVAVLYDTAKDGGFLKEDYKYILDAIRNARRIAKAFNKHGSDARLVRINKKNLKETLQKLKGTTDIVFNLTESVGLELVLETINMLDELNLPYAGANAYGHKLTSDKVLIKKFLSDNNFPTPKFQVIHSKNESLFKTLRFPLIAKAATEHGSMSIHQNAVVTNTNEAKKQIDYLLEKYNGAPVLVEEYIEGREINSTVIGSYDWTMCLPLSEMIFTKSYEKKWPIYTYEAKFNHGTPDFNDVPCKLTNWLPKNENKKIADMSIKICQMTECFDYTRFDLRYDTKNNIPYIIDVNTYPCLLNDHKTDTICVSRLALGWDYATLLEKIAESGTKRWKKRNA